MEGLNMSEENHSLIPGDTYTLNREYALTLLPLSLFLGICVLVGIAGNVFVLIVYRHSNIKKREETYFVPLLALFDVIACTMLGLSGIVVNSFFVYYPSVILCKALFFVVFFSSGTSAGLLLLIALQRYLKICRKKSMSVFWRRFSAIAIVMIYFIVNVLVLVFAGKMKIRVKVGSVIVEGEVCTVGTGRYSQIEFLYQTSVLIWAFINLFGTVALYIPIGCIVHSSTLRDPKVAPLPHSSTTYTSETRFDLLNASDLKNEERSKNKSCTFPEHINSWTVDTVSTTPVDRSVSVNEPSSSHHHFGEADPKGDHRKIESKQTTLSQLLNKANTETVSRLSLARRNFNLMLTTIIITYVISYFSACIMIIVSTMVGEKVYTFSGFALNIYRLLKCFGVLNHMVKSFIYVYFDLKFRSCVKNLLKIH